VLGISYHTLVAYLKGSEEDAGIALGDGSSIADGEASQQAVETLP
jgi:hypothetical protein